MQSRQNFMMWVYKTVWNCWYLLRFPLKNIRIFLRTRDAAVPHFQSKTTIMLRNRNDSWCSPQLHQAYANTQPVVFVSLPGEHDNCWKHPASYVDLLQSICYV
jgi:hypothetical protein